MFTFKSLLKSAFFFLIVTVLLVAQLPLVQAYMGINVYGQADFFSNGVNRNGEASGETLSYPLGLAIDASAGLYIADRDNHRVLYFANDGDTVADRVYGQYGNYAAHISNNNGSGNSGAPSPSSLSMPTAVALDSLEGLYVADRDNHRVLYFANDGDTVADRVYGQFGNFSTNMTNNDGTVTYGEPSADNLGTYVLGLAVDSLDGLYIADSSNHRVLYFANDGDTTADRVYGQWDNFGSNVRNNDGTGKIGAPNANSLNFPRGLEVDAEDGLYIADRDNNRVLYFANDGDTTADRVYGQYGDFTTNVESNDGSGNVGVPSPDNLSHPKDIAIGPQGGLYISDTLHHRVLYFMNDGNTTADGVGGQARDFSMSAINNDGSGNAGTPSDVSLNGPQGITIGPDGLIYVSDTGNNRVLIILCPEWVG